MRHLCTMMGVALALAACGAAPSAAPAPTAPPAQITAAPAPTAEASPTAMPSPTAAPAPTAEASPTAMPSPTAAPADQAAAPSADEAIVQLRRSGGFAGVDETYTIRADGSAVKVDKRGERTQIVDADAAAASTLAQQIADTGITTLAPGSYGPKYQGNDQFSYTIRVMLKGQEYTYTTLEGDGMPAALAKLLDLVQRYVGA